MARHNNTIFALSSVFGRSGVAVIRISGNDALKALYHFNITKEIKPRFATLVKLYDNFNQLIDTGIAIYFPAPNSFTGEDVIELQVHGSKAVIKIILEELSKIFFIAEPGEFALRAFRNGKFKLTQIEGIADLIDAETQMQAKQAIRQISGELERLYNTWRQLIINMQSQIEAYIDFPEDVMTEKSVLVKIYEEIQILIKSIQSHLNDSRYGERLREGFHVVITGEPNVGKSTLFNYLAQRDIAIVSEYAGTTRDVLEAHIDIGGYPIILSDTAGIRESSDPVESEGINRAKQKSAEADLKIALFPLDIKLYDTVEKDDDTIYVLSKADMLIGKKNIKSGNINCPDLKIGNINYLSISVIKGIGTDKLILCIQEKIKEKFGFDKVTPVITRQRHRNCIKQALEHLECFNIDKSIELMSEDLKLAAIELGKIIGVISSEEILDNIFSTFCIGK
ncbi:tRNA uridine-5-carboxymethylaminomethyl(34) synthesis GTPase MnmE [Wolbachia pipientis]|uniref:tRNA modification GTPase MnmE n=1 Tax=Wolbachia pipientis TaxID=955 RepID=A0A1E7QK26_WOLPI|nr:tRNA uridine-5-carboxymethylaminomethyl(34) synthesis GTPase MnmE [Wolbachia pipientis]OEY86825.1 tRNA uridine-5-carboxymethylaminomethyl(34) synthesis GTPase MnmE [Wolbachia pipientis]